jgi:hypothetical protein
MPMRLPPRSGPLKPVNARLIRMCYVAVMAC